MPSKSEGEKPAAKSSRATKAKTTKTTKTKATKTKATKTKATTSKATKAATKADAAPPAEAPAPAPKKPAKRSTKPKTLRVRQVRSTVRGLRTFKRTLEAMGIRHHQHEVVVQDTPAMRGMLRKVRHLIRVTPEE